jgi:propanol-preferring alcohol dehydrogenase
MRQRCYCLTGHHQPLTRREEDVPQPRGAEILVRILGAGVCHSDIHIWDGEYDLGGGKKLVLRDRGVSLPLVMGHEVAGEVAALGPDASGVAMGDKVLVYPWLGCGDCPTCLRDRENLCLAPASIGVYRAGGYAEYLLVPKAKHCIGIGGLDPAEAAPLACSGVTTYSALRKFGPAIADEPVVIMGAGGLGHMALSVLRAMGGKGAIVVDIDEAKRARAVEAGALSAIDGTAPDASKQIVAASGGGARMILDLVGSASTLRLALASATRGTEIVVVGLYGGEVTVPIPFFPLRPLAIRGSYVGNLTELRELVGLAGDGRLRPVKVTRRPLDEATQVLAELKDGKVFGRAVLVP